MGGGRGVTGGDGVVVSSLNAFGAGHVLLSNTVVLITTLSVTQRPVTYPKGF